MKIVIGSDHAGYAAKERIAKLLRHLGHDVMDAGTKSDASCDYPDYARKVADAVAAGKAERGVLICATGLGMAIAANKVRGVRAAVVTDRRTAVLSRSHNDANVFCAGARLRSAGLIAKNLRIWLQTQFEGGRHARRLKKVARLERRH